MKEIIKKGVHENSLYVYKIKCSECDTVYTFEYNDVKPGVFGYYVWCPHCHELDSFWSLRSHRYKKKTKQCPSCGDIINDHEERCQLCQIGINTKRMQELWDEINRRSI